MASGPWDNVQLPGPPNGAQYLQAWANLANATGNQVNNAFNAYRQGQDFQYQQRNRDLFQNGAPDNLADMMRSIIQSGGASTALQAAPMLQRQQLIDQYLQQEGGGGGGGSNINTSPPAQTATGLANAAQNIGAGGGPRVPYSNPATLSATGGDNQGGETVQSLAGAIARAKGLSDISQASIANYAAALGVQPDTPLNADQEAYATTIIGNSLSKQGSSQSAPPATRMAGAGASPIRNDINQGNEPPAGRGPDTTPISPATTTAQGANPPSGAAAMVPHQFRQNPQAFADMLRAQADDISRRSRLGELIGVSSKTAEDRAKAYNDRAKAIEEQLGKDAGQTTEQKNLRTGILQRGEELKGEIAAGQKDLEGINKLANENRVSNQKVQLAKSLLMSPNFYSGPAEGINRSFKQWTATFGGDPNKGTPQEAFQKSVNDLLSEQIRAMAASGVGRVLQSEVQTMQKSIASLGMTPSTNRLLLEEVDRVQKAQMDIQDRANAYVKRNGHLDAGFNQEIASYYQQHPLFSQQELNNPRLIAPPRMPADITRDPVKIKQWAKSNGLKEGDPFAGQDGSGPFRLRMQ